MLQESRYDVILMDVEMPGMDGLEATKAIRAGERGPSHLPIIAMTAHAMQGDRQRCLAAGMDAYLSKPIDGQKMIALVETLAAGLVPGGGRRRFIAAHPATSRRVAGCRRLGYGAGPETPQGGGAFARVWPGPPWPCRKRRLVRWSTSCRSTRSNCRCRTKSCCVPRRQAQEASERYHDLFDFAPVAYFLWDHEGRTLEVNLAGAVLLGLDRGLAVQKRFGQFVAVEDRARFSRVLPAGVAGRCQANLRGRDPQGRAGDRCTGGGHRRRRSTGARGRLCRAAVIDISRQKGPTSWRQPTRPCKRKSPCANGWSGEERSLSSSWGW